MQLNKLEGDAALLFGEVATQDVEAARDAFGQIRAFFTAFDACLSNLQAMRVHCDCPACTNISALSLKAFVHSGEIAIKQVQRFEELAGEPVIRLHRMMKNTVAERVYVLCTPHAAALAQLDPAALKTHSEDLDGFGPTPLWLIDPAELPEPDERDQSVSADRQVNAAGPVPYRISFGLRMRRWLLRLWG